MGTGWRHRAVQAYSNSGIPRPWLNISHWNWTPKWMRWCLVNPAISSYCSQEQITQLMQWCLISRSEYFVWSIVLHVCETCKTIT